MPGVTSAAKSIVHAFEKHPGGLGVAAGGLTAAAIPLAAGTKPGDGMSGAQFVKGALTSLGLSAAATGGVLMLAGRGGYPAQALAAAGTGAFIGSLAAR